MSTRVHHERVRGDGVELHVARVGEGPPVVLLHGFPEDWRSWKHQLPALAGAGFTAVAPDLRGYNESDRPPERSAYHLRHLVADAAAIVRATGHDKAHIVGHDWGGILAWTLAGAHPELVDTLVILNAPHLAIYMEKATRPSLQMLRAWYLLFFRVPRLPEWALSRRDFAAVRDLFRHRPKQPAFSEEDVDGYVRALARPGALTAALNWYRANLGAADAIRLAAGARFDGPVLVIWGEHDPALGVELLEGLERVAPRARVHRIARASHWVQNEAPEEVNRVMIEFMHAESTLNRR
jgi:pimeloyl-ACP methyl ester carboxylesterase